MNREFVDLISAFPAVREAFDSLPEWDKKAICDGLRGCCVTPEEEEAIDQVEARRKVPPNPSDG